MKDEKQYRSFIINVQRNPYGKINTLIVGNKIKGRPADIVAAYAGEDAQILYNILVGRQMPAVRSRNETLRKPFPDRNPVEDKSDDIFDIDLI